MTDDTVSQQRRPRSEGQLIDQPATRQPSSPLRRPNTTPKLRIQRVLSQSASPPKAKSGSGELFCMTKLSDSPPKPVLLEHDDDNCNGGNNADNEDTCITSRENEEGDPDVNASPPSTSRLDPDQEDAGEETAHLHNQESSPLPEAATLPEPTIAPPTGSRLEHATPEVAPESSPDEERPASGGGGMYAQWRNQMELAQAARDKIQNDLAEYLASLSAKQDGAGSALVTFPDNYDTVLNLMTKADLAPAAPTWSKALLQDGLTKKQAHGVIPGEQADAPTDLNIKIAHGIAQIRQLDAKLDDLDLKLNKPTKTKPFMTTPSAPAKKTTSAQRIKDKVEAAKTLGDAPDFISRNKEMKEAGTSLTRTEASRLEALLQSGELADDDDSTAIANPFDATRHDRVDAIEESLKEMQAKRAATPADGVATFGSMAPAPLLAFMPSMAHLDTTQRLAAIDCALQSFRDEDALSAMGGDVDDDAKSVRSEVSRSSSVWSRASTRTVSKRDIETIAAQAKLEVPDDERAPREAITQLLATLSGITIELADNDDDEDQPQVDDADASPPHKPADEPAPMSDSAPPSLSRRKRPTKPATSQPPPTSAFSHLFTLPFEPAGPSRKQIAHSNHR